MKNKDSYSEYHEELNRKAAKENAQLEPLNKKRYLKSREKIDSFIKQKAGTTRRSFLDMASKAGISAKLIKASPLVAGALASQHARAMGGGKRIIYYYIPGGSVPGSWQPSGVGSMGDVTGPFADVASDCHFREVNVELKGHSSAKQALGAPYQTADTIDTDIAAVLSASAPYQSLYCSSELEGRSPDGELFSNAGTPQNDPYDAIEARFRGTLPSSGGLPPFKAALDAQLKALEDLKSRLPAEDLLRLEEHAAAVNALVTRFEREVANSENGPSEIPIPNLPSKNSLYESEQAHITKHTMAQADVIIAALAAGITNVGLLQVFSHQSDKVATYEDGIPSVSFHDGLQHADGTDNNAKFRRCHRYLNEVAAHMIRKLRTTNGPEGEPLINSTAFVQVSCMGDLSHDEFNSPFLLATKIPEFKRSFSNTALDNSVTAKKIHETIANGLGLPFSETAGDLLA